MSEMTPINLGIPPRVSPIEAAKRLPYELLPKDHPEHPDNKKSE